MRIRFFIQVVIAIVAGLGFATAARADAVATVQSFYAALNAPDVNAAMAFVADDAQFINPNGTFKGAAEIRASLEAGAKDGVSFALSNFRDANGRVVYDYKVLVKGEVVETGTDGLTIIKNDKVIFDGTERTELK